MREIKYKYLRDGKWHIWEVNSDFNDNCYYHALHSSSGMLQYIGRKDKNGVEIYEGDIVNCWDWGARPGGLICKSKVFWCVSDAGWGLNPDPTSGDRYDLFRNIEVIGNIYENENPELL